MRWLRDNDPDHAVILVQPQNKVGSYGQQRDFTENRTHSFVYAGSAITVRR